MAKQKQREQESDGIRRDLETPEGILPQQETTAPATPTTEPANETESGEKMTRWRAVHLAIAEVDGDTTYSDIIDRAEELLTAAGEEADRDRLWNDIDKAVTHLQSLGLCDCEWEVRVHPNVQKLGLPGKNGK